MAELQACPGRAPALLSEPRLLVDEGRARSNISRMARRAQQAGLRFRPHFKTHQSRAIGRWFRDAGVDAITVSSLAMAEYFACDGWRDITLAFPFHPGMHARAEALAQRVALSITVADRDALAGVRFRDPVDVWLKIDVGAGRTGLAAADSAGVTALASHLARRGDLRWRGLLAHAGHSYAARGREEILEVHRSSLQKLNDLREELTSSLCNCEISVGDTPTCSKADGWPGVNEIRPGNFVFHDLSQWQIGACDIDQIALVLACPVVARHPERGCLVVHGGAVHFSRESLNWSGSRIYGLLAEIGAGGGPRQLVPGSVIALSQEHGTLSASAETIAAVRPGDTLAVVPVHACLTADAMGCYYRMDGTRLDSMRAREPA